MSMLNLIPPLLWAIAIFIGSSIPASKIPGQVFFSDKIIHVVEYAVLGMLIAGAVQKQASRYTLISVFVIAWALSVCYGVSDEIHQLFIIDRTAEVNDIIADIWGSAFGIAGWMIWKKRRYLVSLIHE